MSEICFLYSSPGLGGRDGNCGGGGGGGVLVDGAGPSGSGGIEHGEGYGAGGGGWSNQVDEATYTGYDGVIILDLI